MTRAYVRRGVMLKFTSHEGRRLPFVLGRWRRYARLGRLGLFYIAIVGSHNEKSDTPFSRRTYTSSQVDRWWLVSRPSNMT